MQPGPEDPFFNGAFPNYGVPRHFESGSLSDEARESFRKELEELNDRIERRQLYRDAFGPEWGAVLIWRDKVTEWLKPYYEEPQRSPKTEELLIQAEEASLLLYESAELLRDANAASRTWNPEQLSRIQSVAERGRDLSVQILTALGERREGIPPFIEVAGTYAEILKLRKEYGLAEESPPPEPHPREVQWNGPDLEPQ